jgi:hypothetical protein
MIYQVLRIVAHELNEYFVQLESQDGKYVVLGNIAAYEPKNDNQGNASADEYDNKVVVTLVNLQEEKTLKNRPHYKNNALDRTEYKNPPVPVNIYVLFTATNRTYDNALIYVSRVINFFQGKFLFTNQNTPVPSVTPGIENMSQFRLMMDMYSPTFEESNYLWGTLGGKQYPSVLYRIRKLDIDAELKIAESGIIETIQTKEGAL